MNPCELDALETAYTKLAPSDPVSGYSWLFDSDWPDLPGGKRGEYGEEEEQILEARRDAIRQIYDYGGVEALDTSHRQIQRSALSGYNSRSNSHRGRGVRTCSQLHGSQ